jgi:outer membrane lipoprotein SlyB
MTSTLRLRPLWAAAFVLAATLSATQAQAAPCSTCGRVEAVHRVQNTGSTSGVGAVAGGVVGGVVGNQVGNGRGRTLATVAGATGGALAGNSVERNRNTSSVYRVSVRMDNGSMRTIESHSPPHVGQSVSVHGNSLQIRH